MTCPDFSWVAVVAAAIVVTVSAELPTPVGTGLEVAAGSGVASFAVLPG